MQLCAGTAVGLVMSLNPLILTLALDEASQAFFNNLRRQHFPAARNYLDAHLTLFHNLPAGEEQIETVVKQLAEKQSIIRLKVTEVRSIGNGVAYKMESNELMQLHKNLQQQWQPWLIPQDTQKLWPHITIQNKADPQDAARLKDELSTKFEPFEVQGTGLSLWEYMGGPWKHLETYRFSSSVK